MRQESLKLLSCFFIIYNLKFRIHLHIIIFMANDFKYKDFINKLRFKFVSGYPADFDKYWKDFVWDFVYEYSSKTAKDLYDASDINVEACEIITQTIAEWTFHRVIDLIYAQIPTDFIDIIIKKINSEIYEYLINKNNDNALTLEHYTMSDYVSLTEIPVSKIYKDSIKELYEDKIIDYDTYKFAIMQSHYDNYSGKIDNISSDYINKDDFKRVSKQNEGLFNDIKKHPMEFCVFLIFVLIGLFLYLAGFEQIEKYVRYLGLFISSLSIVCWFIVLTNYDVLEQVNNSKKNKLITESDENVDSFKFNCPNLMFERLGVDILSVRMGSALVDYADPELKNVLLPLIGNLRKELADELGYIIPKVRCLDDASYKPYEFGIYVRSIRRDTFFVDKFASQEDISKVVLEHMRMCFVKHVNDILTKKDVIKYMELVRSENPTLVNDLVPELISAVDLRRILVHMVREEIPIKDILFIFEILCDIARFNKKPEVLLDLLRAQMSSLICEKYSVKFEGKSVLYVIALTEETEKTLLDALKWSELGPFFLLDSSKMSNLINIYKSALESVNKNKENVVLLVNPKIRVTLFDFLSKYFEDVKVISYAELISDIEVEVIAKI